MKIIFELFPITRWTCKCQVAENQNKKIQLFSLVNQGISRVIFFDSSYMDVLVVGVLHFVLVEGNIAYFTLINYLHFWLEGHKVTVNADSDIILRFRHFLTINFSFNYSIYDINYHVLKFVKITICSIERLLRHALFLLVVTSNLCRYITIPFIHQATFLANFTRLIVSYSK